jgi:uncharacterized DUF497 family protein
MASCIGYLRPRPACIYICAAMSRRIEYDGFQWDQENREKCQQHGVSRAEIESLFRLIPGVYDDPEHSEQEPRSRAIGPTDTGRYVFVAFTVREVKGNALIRPISARYMHDKEVQHYERQKTP